VLVSYHGKITSNACFHSAQNFRLLVCNAETLNPEESIILAVVLYGCRTWYMMLMKEYELAVSEIGALRKIFGSWRE
jgi:hypothetical protein